MTKLQRQEGWFEGDQYRKDLQTELEKYIQRATKRGYNFVAIKKWSTRLGGGVYRPQYGWDRVRLLDLKTGRIRNMYYNIGWRTTTAKAKEKVLNVSQLMKACGAEEMSCNKQTPLAFRVVDPETGEVLCEYNNNGRLVFEAPRE